MPRPAISEPPKSHVTASSRLHRVESHVTAHACQPHKLRHADPAARHLQKQRIPVPDRKIRQEPQPAPGNLPHDGQRLLVRQPPTLIGLQTFVVIRQEHEFDKGRAPARRVKQRLHLTNARLAGKLAEGAPRKILRRANPRFLRVPQNVPENGEQVALVVHRFALETLLKQMPDPPVFVVEVEDIGRGDFLHEHGRRSLLRHAQQQMHVVGHQAVSGDIRSRLRGEAPHSLKHYPAVLIVKENVKPIHPAENDVRIPRPALRPRFSWHRHPLDGIIRNNTQVSSKCQVNEAKTTKSYYSMSKKLHKIS